MGRLYDPFHSYQSTCGLLASFLKRIHVYALYLFRFNKV